MLLCFFPLVGQIKPSLLAHRYLRSPTASTELRMSGPNIWGSDFASHPLLTFPDGCIVSIKSHSPFIKGWLSSTSDTAVTGGPAGGRPVTLRSSVGSLEHFRLRKCGSSIAHLQDLCGFYLMPDAVLRDASWVTSSDCSSDKAFHFDLVELSSDGFPAVFKMWAESAGHVRSYLSVAESGGVELCIDSLAATSWTVQMVSPPTLTLIPVSGHIGLCDSLERADGISELSPHVQTFVLQVVRAMREFGAFFLIGHGIQQSEDLLQSLQASVGPLPYQDDVDLDDGLRKQNWALVTQEGEGELAFHDLPRVVDATHVDAFRELCRVVYAGTENLCHGLLHCMVLGASVANGTAGSRCEWRGVWRHPLSLKALRILSYHPGPALDRSGATVLTTAHHTDSTWLTVLRQDAAGGLEIRPPAATSFIDAAPIVPGALLINAGNILQKASGGFYKAVCHRVIRRSTTATRHSLIFFYDRYAGDEFHGGGTGGC